jgi:hypothetical protein
VKKLLVYLDSHPHISIRQFCRIAHIKYDTACNILSDLIAVDTLKYRMVDKQIVYSKASGKTA